MLKHCTDESTFISANAATQVHTGLDYILSFIATANSSSRQTISINDDPNATTLLMIIDVSVYGPLITRMLDERAIRFEAGFHVIILAAASIFFSLPL